jgi:hypothetical protein
MLDSVQTKNLIFVYDELMSSEANGWTDIDDFLEVNEWLDDSQIYRECEVIYSFHRNTKMGGPYEDNPKFDAFVKRILEAVDSILFLYQETNDLHIKNRYILSYYLALSQCGQIVSLDA